MNIDIKDLNKIIANTIQNIVLYAMTWCGSSQGCNSAEYTEINQCDQLYLHAKEELHDHIH